MISIKGVTTDQEKQIQKARKRVIEAIANNMDLYGVTHSTGHLYGLMFFQDKPMSLDDMGEAMEMSKTSMSMGVRTLVDLKMVNKVWEKGSRKDFYEVEQDWYQTLSDYFTIKWNKAAEVNLQALRKSLKELQDMLAASQGEEPLETFLKSDIEKINQAIRYYMWLNRLIETFETGEIFNFVPKEDGMPRK